MEEIKEVVNKLMNLLRTGKISSSTTNKDVLELLKEELNSPISTRVEQFEKKLDSLIEEFSNLSCSDIADSLGYYTSMYQQKANLEENES